jgi:tetratricopeptide (TPR) repeat protein
MLAGLASGRDTALTRLAAVTTHSLPALKAFLEGERLLRAGKDGPAAAAFREAATLDTTFALAQYRLAITATWAVVGGAEDPTAWAAMAARHAERLSPLIRDLLTAYRAYRDFDSDAAERRYREITEGYPDNVEAWLMLGETLFHFNGFRGRSPAEAWPAFGRVLALEPGNPHAMVHLARLAAREGRTATLDTLVRGYLERHEDAERSLEMRALWAYVRDDAVESAVVVDLAGRAGELTVGSLLPVALSYAQRPEAVRALVPALTGSVRSRNQLTVARRQFTDLALMSGRLGEPAGIAMGPFTDPDWSLETRALVASDPFFMVDRAEVAAVRDSVAARPTYPGLGTPLGVTPRGVGDDPGAEMRTYLLGLLSVRLGDTAAARRAVASLRAVAEPGHAGAAASLARGVMAEVARARGDAAGALRELEQFTYGLSTDLAHWGVRERFLRAELLRALGREADALPWYESFGITYDLPWVAPAHLRSGEIHERLGNAERAVFHYGRFVDLWKACDPELRPLVGRAEQALVRLGGRRD